MGVVSEQISEKLKNHIAPPQDVIMAGFHIEDQMLIGINLIILIVPLLVDLLVDLLQDVPH